MRKYMSEEHRERVAAVLEAEGAVQRLERTLRMLKGAKQGTAMRNAIDDQNRLIATAQEKKDKAVSAYMSFVRDNHDAMLLHWMRGDLMMDDLTVEVRSAATTG